MTVTDPIGPSVLLLGNYRPTLILARELKASGLHVIAGLEGCDRGAELSRHVDKIWDHPELATSRDAFLEALNALLSSRPDIGCVFPVAENFVRLFAEVQPALPSHVTLANVAAETVNACLDKRASMELAVACGVPIAPFAEATTLEALHREADRLGYPLVIRPADSTLRLDGEKALRIASRTALDELIPVWPEGQSALILQRKAQGIRHNLYFAALDGVMCRALHAVITRTDRIDGAGLAVDGITIELDADLMRHTQAMLAELDYSGIGCAQFLVDEDSGAVSFLEINPRIAGNHAVPQHCGLDLGRFLVALSRGERDGLADGDMRIGRAGVRYSWLAGDIDGLKSSLKRREISLLQAWSWLGKLIDTARGAELDMMLSRDDRLPGIITLLDVIPGIGHITRRRNALGWLTRKRAIEAPKAPLLPIAPLAQR